MKKAQIELITILGVVVVIFVIAYYALVISNQPPNPVPSGVGAEQSLVQDKVEGIIRDGALLSIKWMESQGGAVLPIFDNSVSFTRVMVPYWQKCEKTYVPSLDLLTRQLENATYNYIAYNLYQSEIVLGKNVTVDLANTKVTASILDNKIDLQVSMPTNVQGYAIQQPYKASIPTKFGEIYRFMKAYAEEAAKNRSIELFMINSIYFSKTVNEGGVPHAEVPTFGVLTECGETIDRTPEQLSKGMEDLLEYTLTHIYWWTTAPTDRSVPKVYAIENLKGKTYPQLNPLFFVDDNFGINIGSTVHLTNPRPLASAPALFGFKTSGLCIGTYSISYAFQIPIILKVDDPLTGTPFNIATLIDINDMMPGSCGEIPAPQYCEYKPGNNIACTGSGLPPQTGCGECTAKMKVVTPDGNPAKDAMTSFGGCALPRTDASGNTEGGVSCDAGDLTIVYIKSGIVSQLYQRRSCGISPAGLNGTMTVHQYPKLAVHFRDVNVTTCNATITSNFFIINTTSENGCQDFITNVNMTDTGACTDQLSCSQQLSHAAAEEKIPFELLQPGTHSASAYMLNSSDSSNSIIGAFESSFAIGQASRNIYVYMPLFTNLSVTSRADIVKLTNDMVTNCSISPVMEVDKA